MAPNKTLSKSKIVAHRQCPRRLWLQVYRPDLAVIDSAAEARFRDGNEVGDMARKIHPGGRFIETLDRTIALQETKEAIEGPPHPIFEAAFFFDDVLIRADLLLPDDSGYHLIEVKSSTSVKDYHHEDVAIQTWVIQQTGLTPTRVSLAHINNQFEYPGEQHYDGLLTEVDLSASTQPLVANVLDWVQSAKATIASATEPSVNPGLQCAKPFECEFRTHCTPPELDVEYPVEILPYGKKLASKLRSEGYRDLREVPTERFSNPKHVRIHRVTKTGQAELDEEARQTLQALPFPRYYLDFETIAFAVPIWVGTKPYSQLPFQWSCHVEQADGALSHDEFLDISGNDPRRAFAKSLVDALGSVGPVIVYNAPFEGSRLKELAEVFPDLSSNLLAIKDRLFDLLPLARNHYYHPDMKGSWSIKAVLPTVSKLNYATLDVQDGGMAQEAYRKIILGDASEDDKKSNIKHLLQYCEQDTQAMLELASWFSCDSRYLI